MRKLVLAALALVALSACGKDATGPTRLGADPQAFVGRWTLQLSAAPGCWAAAMLYFQIDSSEMANLETCSSSGCTPSGSAGSRFFNVISSTWSWDSTFGSHLPLTGSVNVDDGTATLALWKTVLAHGGRFEGTFGKDLVLQGTFTDVGNGFALAPGCSSAATASHY